MRTNVASVMTNRGKTYTATSLKFEIPLREEALKTMVCAMPIFVGEPRLYFRWPAADVHSVATIWLTGTGTGTGTPSTA